MDAAVICGCRFFVVLVFGGEKFHGPDAVAVVEVGDVAVCAGGVDWVEVSRCCSSYGADCGTCGRGCECCGYVGHGGGVGVCF